MSSAPPFGGHSSPVRCTAASPAFCWLCFYYLRCEGLKVAGIIAEGLWENGARSGFNLLDITDNELTPLCRAPPETAPAASNSYVFSGEGMAAGREGPCPRERCSPADVIIVDEVGPLERSGEGDGAPSLSPLLVCRVHCILWGCGKSVSTK